MIGSIVKKRNEEFYYYLHLPIILIISIWAIFYFNFTAEDAYITYRYAENWVNIGSLVYNQGEPINAMTSPLHAILSAAFFLLTRQTVLSNKIAGFFLLLLSALFVWIRFRNRPHWQALALILVLLPPSVLLWTFGGLETPILLFLVTITVFLVDRAQSFNLLNLSVIFVLAGLALLTRYDSILFFIPVLIYTGLKAHSIKHVLIASLVASILPVAWFSISILYYGDLLPTSFYVKTPIGNITRLFYNGQYIASNLLFVGIIPVLVLAFVLLLKKPSTLSIFYVHFKSMWWLYLGLMLQIMYGLTMATHHMMFSFRSFVPYLPASAFLVVHLFSRAAEANKFDLFAGRSAILFTGFLLLLTLFQFYQLRYTYNRSLNGLSSIGEYRSMGVRDYIQLMQVLKQEALDIEAHWAKVKDGQNRRPRIITFAAGMLPYTFRDSYIYEKLVSYRHCHQRIKQGLHADYIHIVAPRHGTVDKQLAGPDENYSLVSSYEILFDGSKEQFLVYYNPSPQEHNLSNRIFDPCRQEGPEETTFNWNGRYTTGDTVAASP